jgi:5-methylcytosine-specific restriction protein A
MTNKNLKSLKYCKYKGCRNTTRERHCETCQREIWRKDAKQREEQLRFYKTKEWKALRNLYITAHPICEETKCTQPAQVVDHIQPIIGADGKERDWLKLDPNNLQSLCPYHHNAKRATERRPRQRSKLN